MRKRSDVYRRVVAAAAVLVATVSLLFLCDSRAVSPRFPTIPVSEQLASFPAQSSEFPALSFRSVVVVEGPMSRDPSTCWQREGRAIVYDRWHGDDQMVLPVLPSDPFGSPFPFYPDGSPSVGGQRSGKGFGRLIGELRRNGLDVVVVVDGTGSMNLIIQDVKSKITQLVVAIHRLVPIARVGVVVFGGSGQCQQLQPLTPSADKLASFLSGVKAMGGGEMEEDTKGAIETAVNKMDYDPFAKKVIVLVGDSPPKKEDFAEINALIAKFRGENGTLNTIDVAAEEHERFERLFWLKVHGMEPPSISPLPQFYQQTHQAYKVLAAEGGGAMRTLSKDSHIDEQVLILAFGDQWQNQIAAFGSGLTAPR